MFFIVPPLTCGKFPDGSMLYIEKSTARFDYLRVYKPVTSHYTTLNKRCNRLYDGTTYEYEYTEYNNGVKIQYEKIKVPTLDTTTLIKHTSSTPFKYSYNMSDLSYFVLIESHCGFNFSTGSHNRAKLQEQCERNFHLFNCLSLRTDEDNFLFNLHNNFIGFIEMMKMRTSTLDDPIKFVLSEVIKRVKNHLLFLNGKKLLLQYKSPEIDFKLYSIEERKRNISQLAISHNIKLPFYSKLNIYNNSEEIGEEEFLKNIDVINNVSFELLIKEHEEEMNRVKNHVKQELINTGNIAMSCVIESL